MNWEKEALDFISELATQYFVKRDIDAVRDYLEEQTSIIGTGREEISRNLEEVYQALQNDAEEYGRGFKISCLQCETVPIKENICIVYGTVRAVPETSEVSVEDLRFTTVLEEIEGKIKLLHLHFSHADHLQEEGQYFVSASALKNNRMLREALSVRSRQLENLTQNIPGGVHQCKNDANMTLLSMSDGFLKMFGYTREEIRTLFKDQFINMIYPGDRANMLRAMHMQLQNGTEIEVEYRVLCKNEQPMWILDKGRIVDDPEAGTCFCCILVEINDRKHEQEELRLSLERHQVIMDQTTDIIFEWDIRKDTLHFSSNWKRKFGYDAIGEKISVEIPVSKNMHPEDTAAFVQIMKAMAAGVPYAEAEFRICNSKKQYIWCRIRATAQYDENKRPIKAVGVISDIDREKKQKQELMEQAQRDALTGLYNKAAIDALVEQKMGEMDENSTHALLIMDIDKFKQINDTYGHQCGDRILSDVSEVLKNQIRECDLTGRIGGDEFLVYFTEVGDEQEAYDRTEALLSTLQTITPEQGAPPITCSIGIAVFPKNDADYQKIYRYADIALYYRKKNGRNGVTLYESSFGEEEAEIGASV